MARLGARLAHLAGRADRLRQVGDEDRDQQPDPDSLATGQPDPEHELLGDPVEEGAERQRRAGVRAALAPRPAAAGGRAGGDQPVEAEVGERARAEAERGGAEAADPQSLRRQLEADRADQRPGAEGENQPDLPLGPAPVKASRAPITSDEAASAPQPSAAIMVGSIAQDPVCSRSGCSQPSPGRL